MKRNTYEIYSTESFYKQYQKLDKSNQNRINKIREQLKGDPYTGKSLGYEFFREKKFNGFRLYYLIFEQYLVVLIITYTDKKAQQATIEAIKKKLDNYKEYIEKQFKTKK